MGWISSNLSWLTPLLSTLVGAGIIKYSFFSVNQNQIGVWLRLGRPTYDRKGRLKVVRHGRPGIRWPFIYKLIKVTVAINPTTLDDMEMVRKTATGGRESWKATGESLWQKLDDDESLLRSIFSTKDEDAALEQTVKSTLQRTIKEVLQDNPVGTLEDSTSILKAVERKCGLELKETYGVKLVNTNIFRLRPVDASILRGLLDSNDPDKPPSDGDTSANETQAAASANIATVITIAQQSGL